MTTDSVLKLLARLERRLATIEDQARETCSQAEHTLDRLGHQNPTYKDILQMIHLMAA